MAFSLLNALKIEYVSCNLLVFMSVKSFKVERLAFYENCNYEFTIHGMSDYFIFYTQTTFAALFLHKIFLVLRFYFTLKKERSYFESH